MAGRDAGDPRSIEQACHPGPLRRFALGASLIAWRSSVRGWGAFLVAAGKPWPGLTHFDSCRRELGEARWEALAVTARGQ